MDQQPPAPPPAPSLFEMDFDAASQHYINSISKWGKFIGITLLAIILLCVVSLAASYREVLEQFSQLMAVNDTAVSTALVIFGVILLLAIVWLVYLLRACAMLKQGLVMQNSDRIAEGFKSLRTVFTIGIVFSVLSILSTIISMINV
jgi:hypothetical protein